ncbi:uncharacterized protein [Dysidea avara]|uniref:uncharacterized protein n=1 Tax=Dysidea avara TaxID=196820 RepID=UPI00331A741A
MELSTYLFTARDEADCISWINHINTAIQKPGGSHVSTEHLSRGPPLTQQLSGDGNTPPDLPLSPPPPIGFTGQDVEETEPSELPAAPLLCLTQGQCELATGYVKKKNIF